MEPSVLEAFLITLLCFGALFVVGIFILIIKLLIEFLIYLVTKK